MIYKLIIYGPIFQGSSVLLLISIYTKQQNPHVYSFPLWVSKSPLRPVMVSIPPVISYLLPFRTASQV